LKKAPNPALATIILAAGKGTRMKSDAPKVIHKLAGLPMVARVVHLSEAIGSVKTVVIIGYKYQMVIDALADEKVEYAIQKDQLGTGHAVEQARDNLKNFKGNVLILSGDVPLLSKSTLLNLLSTHSSSEADATILSADVDDPTGYGRVIRRTDNTLDKIVEHKDASDTQRLIPEINAGIYIINSETLFELLPKVKNKNAQQEYYLPDVLPMILSKKGKVSIEKTENSNEILGVNTVKQLEELNEIYKKRNEK
jgi:UDP-N-acetylglucosamine diphosphorylase/glucosamine-1-phosphate N-acetyltransferase